MSHEVKVAERAATLVVSKRFPVTIPVIGAVLSRAFGEVYGHLQASKIEPDGPPFVIYHGSPAGGTPFDVEVCAPVSGTVGELPAGWLARTLEPGTFATLLHVGPYDTIASTYEAIGFWIAAHDLQVVGAPREVYLTGPEVPPEQTRTIIEFPVSAAEVAVGA